MTIIVPTTSFTVNTTAGDQINGALRLIGQLAEGETPSPETSADALTALNQMLDSWSIERLAVYTTYDQSYTWPANTATRTLGPSGNFVGTRLAIIDEATYFRDPSSGVSFNVQLVNQQQYNSIALKTVTSTYPQILLSDQTYPDTTLTTYPVANMALEWHFFSMIPLVTAASLFTILEFPSGYLRAFRYNLACELAPEFGVEPSPTVQRIAMTSKRNLKRINNPFDLMAMPYGITGTREPYNVYSGNM